MSVVIVVGARCGGSPTAMLLARRGYRVLLVDKAQQLTLTNSVEGVTAMVRRSTWVTPSSIRQARRLSAGDASASVSVASR